MQEFISRLTVFAIIAAVFEVLALVLIHGLVTRWVVTGLVVLFVLYLLVLAVRGWRRQARIDYPAVMTGRVVHKRHWHLF